MLQAAGRVHTRSRPGFTLVELIAVIVVLAVMAGIAIPKYIDSSVKAKEAADVAAIAGITSAMQMAFFDHQLRNAPSSEYITSVNDIGAIMESGDLPQGIVTHGAFLEDQRGHRYLLIAETSTRAARLNDLGTGGKNGWGY
ncbi:MAG: prepilin-type N-terminal cleavage/methylation domain-containing protein [Planctomycetota bacterium]|nr:prepilin-type N-terminal cleavage/methylation domain-containing protein [Planctomycetota bacterium]